VARAPFRGQRDLLNLLSELVDSFPPLIFPPALEVESIGKFCEGRSLYFFPTPFRRVPFFFSSARPVKLNVLFPLEKSTRTAAQPR